MIDPVSIIIVAYNRLDMLANCLQQIRANSDYPYELILVDNGSDRDTAGFIKQQADKPDVVAIHRFSKNAGFAVGYSRGMQLATRPYRLLINDDTEPGKRWLSRLMAVAAQYPDAGLIMPYTNFACNPNIVCKAGGITETKMLGPSEDVPAVCWMVSDACYQDVCGVIDQLRGGSNFFHDEFEYGWAEDILTSAIIRELGYRRFVAGGSFIYHHGFQTQRILAKTGDYRTRNMQRLDKYLKILKTMEIKRGK